MRLFPFAGRITDPPARGDLAKCAGHKCTLRDGCDRFVRPAADRQTWVEPEWRHAAVPLWLADDVVQMVHCINHVPIQEREVVDGGDGA